MTESLSVDDWLARARDALASEAGVPAAELELDDAAVNDILDMARIAAHVSGDRRNAPLLAYLAGRSGGDVGNLAERIRGLGPAPG